MNAKKDRSLVETMEFIWLTIVNRPLNGKNDRVTRSGLH